MIADEEIAALHELDAHPSGEEGVLEVGGVERPRCENHHGRIVDARRSLEPERLEQHRAVVVDSPDRVAAEEQREGSPHGGAVLDHVGDAARYPQVVLQDAVHTHVVAHDVDAGNHHPGASPDGDAVGRALVSVRAPDEPFGDDAVAYRLGIADIEVVEEEIQRLGALDETGLHHAPFGSRDDARYEIDGPRAFRALVAAVDGEGDAEVAERRVGEASALVEIGRAQRIEAVDQLAIVGTHAVGVEDLAEGRSLVVPVE